MNRFTKPSSRTGLSIGACSILVIFVLLCLVTFAVLSLVSANADQALSDKNLAHTRAYYAAETTAWQQLSALDAILAEHKTDNDTEYFSACTAAIQSTDWQISQTERGLFATLTQPINESQDLIVTVQIRDLAARAAAQMAPADSSQAGCYAITEWRVEGTHDWQPNDGLPVYGGQIGALPTL